MWEYLWYIDIDEHVGKRFKMNTVGLWHKNKDYIILLAKTNMLLSAPDEKDKRFGKLLFPPAKDKHINISSKTVPSIFRMVIIYS